MIHSVIIDDEQRSINVLTSILTEYFSNVKIEGTTTEPAKGIDLIRQTQPDLLFLDVRMQHTNAFDLLSHFTDPPFKVVLTTAYDNHAIQAVKHSVFDYLLKPISILDLKATIERFIEWRERHHAINGTPLHPIKTHIPIPSVHGYDFIKTDDIVWIKASEAYTVFCLVNKKTITASGNIKKYEAMLDEQTFLRIHHSHIINTRHILKYVRAKHSYVIMVDGSELDVSVRRRDVIGRILH